MKNMFSVRTKAMIWKDYRLIKASWKYYLFPAILMFTIVIIRIFRYTADFTGNVFEWENFNIFSYALFNFSIVSILSLRFLYGIEKKNYVNDSIFASQTTNRELFQSRILSVFSFVMIYNAFFSSIVFIIVFLKFSVLPDLSLVLTIFAMVPVLALIIFQFFYIAIVYFPKIVYVDFLFTAFNFAILRFKEYLHVLNPFFVIPVGIVIAFIINYFMIRIPKSTILKND